MKWRLKALTEEDRTLLDSLFTKEAFGEGDTVIRQGQQHGSLYFLEEGALRVEQSVNERSVPISMMVPGELFGEVSFLTGEGASSSVVAAKYSVLKIIRQEALEHLLVNHPDTAIRFYKSLAIMLAERLKQNTRPILTPTTWR